MRVGVLALQGGFAEHLSMLRGLNIEAREVRLPKELDKLD
jgi:pyridoxal 5'-phosphate synthase pdxT subunit